MCGVFFPKMMVGGSSFLKKFFFWVVILEFKLVALFLHSVSQVL
jgi:hypothetical protein